MATPVRAAAPVAVPEAPVLHPSLRPGEVTRTAVDVRTPSVHRVDGQLGDWIGAATRFAGAGAFSAGEYVYSDHLFDAYGPDNGNDTDRQQLIDLLARILPETYRLEPLGQIDPFDELGVPVDYPLSASEQYGDAGFVPAADIHEVRVAVTEQDVHLLVRTTTMTAADQPAVLVLADTAPGAAARGVPFASNLSTAKADVAAIVVGSTVTVADLRTGALITTTATAATNPTGYDNAVEARFPRRLLEGAGGAISLAVATGKPAPDRRSFAALADAPGGARIANVAFRPNEPVRTWFDKQQALALGAGTIDPFFASIDASDSQAGVTERIGLVPGGYYERIFESSPAISTEGGNDGVLQHYGVYVPLRYDGTRRPLPATFWMHWRGGKAHSGATVSPRIMRDQGDGHGGFVFAPRGRGTSTWYLGEGMVDVNEVWADATASFPVDADRVYVSGHSMGGWASWLFPILYPDRFAGAYPVEGPLTEGAWTGVDVPGCDDLYFEDFADYTPCYIATNDSDPRTQHTFRLLENLRNVPMAIYQGAIDELVPVSGVTVQVNRLQELGYRYRYYLFPTYEHYTHPIVDEWAEGARYLDRFRRDRNPARVTYIRDMPFEETVETGPSRVRPTLGLNFDFDHAYWMSQLTPADPVNGVARFDGRSLAIPAPPVINVPEAGGPVALGQAGPFVMVGQSWLTNPLTPTPPTTNGFTFSLTGATRVALDLTRMAIRTTAPINGQVTADRPFQLRLSGAWAAIPTVRINGAPVARSVADGALVINVPAGNAVIAVS